MEKDTIADHIDASAETSQADGPKPDCGCGGPCCGGERPSATGFADFLINHDLLVVAVVSACVNAILVFAHGLFFHKMFSQ